MASLARNGTLIGIVFGERVSFESSQKVLKFAFGTLIELSVDSTSVLQTRFFFYVPPAELIFVKSNSLALIFPPSIVSLLVSLLLISIPSNKKFRASGSLASLKSLSSPLLEV